MLNYIGKLIQAVKGQIQLNRKLTEEEERQKKEGYSIELPVESRGRWIIYREGKRELCVGVKFNVINDVVLFTQGLEKWVRPSSEKLTDIEYRKALNRVVRYLSAWGGTVSLNDSLIEDDHDKLRQRLEEKGIPFEEYDGVITYKLNIETEKDRKEF